MKHLGSFSDQAVSLGNPERGYRQEGESPLLSTAICSADLATDLPYGVISAVCFKKENNFLH